MFEDLNLLMDKYVLHSDFHDLDNGLDLVPSYVSLELLGTININVQNKFTRLWCKKKKAILLYTTHNEIKRKVKEEQVQKSIEDCTHESRSKI